MLQAFGDVAFHQDGFASSITLLIVEWEDTVNDLHVLHSTHKYLSDQTQTIIISEI